jgi:aspartate-semialdehyde dehydrogenase
MQERVVAVVGATGAVGEEVIAVLQEMKFPVKKLVPLASASSAGKEVEFNGQSVTVLELTESVFEEQDVEIAIFSAGGSISAKFAPFAVEAGAVVIDNTSHFRMDPKIPLVVPEVNPEDIAKYKESGIIANPNCSTIQMVQVLKPLDELFDIKRVDVSTYQATSGAGKKGMHELVTQTTELLNFKELTIEAFAHQIAMNLIPHIDVFQPNDYTKEELKMVYETQKILHKDVEVSATCVRVPVLRSHSESITITFNNPVDVAKAKEALANFENMKVIDNPAEKEYPMPITATGTDYTYVGRVRADIYNPNILHLWCVADQVRVGAATNAVRIAKKFIEKYEES